PRKRWSRRRPAIDRAASLSLRMTMACSSVGGIGGQLAELLGCQLVNVRKHDAHVLKVISNRSRVPTDVPRLFVPSRHQNSDFTVNQVLGDDLVEVDVSLIAFTRLQNFD